MRSGQRYDQSPNSQQTPSAMDISKQRSGTMRATRAHCIRSRSRGLTKTRMAISKTAAAFLPPISSAYQSLHARHMAELKSCVRGKITIKKALRRFKADQKTVKPSITLAAKPALHNLCDRNGHKALKKRGYFLRRASFILSSPAPLERFLEGIFMN